MADEADLNSGLLGIALSDSDDDGAKECAEPAPASRQERNAQSEQDFQRLKSTYRVKVENGEASPTLFRRCTSHRVADSRKQIWKSVQLPLGEIVSKPAAQELVHAVEELYFFRRYAEAVAFIRRIWHEGGGEGGGLDHDSRELLHYYERRCEEKMSVKGDVGMT